MTTIAQYFLRKGTTNYILASFNIPTTESTPNTTNLINLNKVEDRFTINGGLNNGKLHASETYTTAENKKNALKTMFGLGSVVVMNWEGTDYEVGIDKYEIDYQAMDDPNNQQSDVMIYTVTISCVVGEDLV